MSSKNQSQSPPRHRGRGAVHNEEDNIQPLVSKSAKPWTVAAFRTIYVDGGSTDRTVSVLRELAATDTALRVVVHQAAMDKAPRWRRAFVTPGHHNRDPGRRRSERPGRYPGLDGRVGTNPNNGCLLIAGHRLRRTASGIKRTASRVANNVRAIFWKDDTPDTGCGLKVFAKSAFLDLPRFDHMHRYLPALFIRAGGRVVSVPVNHRPRERGTSKYGVIDRLVVRP